MGQTTAIAWADATWNVARGCSKVDEDCKFCYMYRDSMENTRYDPKSVVRTKTVFNAPLKWIDPKRIFTSSLTDFFHEGIDDYRWECFYIMYLCPHHTFLVLTKRPHRFWDAIRQAYEKACLERLDELAAWLKDWINGRPPKNVWLGTSVGSQASVHRIEQLVKLPATIRFVSFEPLHGSIDLMDVPSIWNAHNELKIDWAIIGGESGNEKGKYLYRPCSLSWIRMLEGQCFHGKAKVFIKQLGTYLAKQLGLRDRHGTDPLEWPEYLQVQDFPNTDRP